MKPRVSVVLCSYNQGEYLAEAVESVLRQSMSDWELIAIDNGSSDDSHEVLRRFASDPRVHLFLHTENDAISRRLNQGVASATGDFVSFLYSDDWYLPTKLEKQLARFDELGASCGVVYGPAVAHSQASGARWQLPSFRGSGRILKSFLLQYPRANMDMLSPLSRTDCFRRYPFYEDIFAEGEASYLKLAMSYEFSFLPEPLVILRNHGGNRGRAIQRNAAMTFDCLDRLGRHPDFPTDCQTALRQLKLDLWNSYGWQGARLNVDRDWVFACYANAYALSWRAAVNPRTIAGCAISVLPMGLRRRLNRAGHWLRQPRGDRNTIDSYGGGDR